jgi:hypothetical protein
VPTPADLQAKRDALRDRLDQNEAALAAKVADLEQAEGSVEDKRDRDPRNPRRAQKLREEIADLIEDIDADRERSRELRKRHQKLTEALANVTRKLRNLASPKVVDLAFDRGAVRGLTRQSTIRGSVGHYTAGPLDNSDAEAFDLWRRYDSAHKAQGWSCLGYNVGVTRQGTIVRLRGIEYVGAHTLNYNTGQVGISVHGTTGDTWTLVQRRALRKLLKKYGLSGKPVIGHHQAPGQSTACPGSFLNGYVTKGKQP